MVSGPGPGSRERFLGSGGSQQWSSNSSAGKGAMGAAPICPDLYVALGSVSI